MIGNYNLQTQKEIDALHASVKECMVGYDKMLLNAFRMLAPKELINDKIVDEAFKMVNLELNEDQISHILLCIFEINETLGMFSYKMIFEIFSPDTLPPDLRTKATNQSKKSESKIEEKPKKSNKEIETESNPKSFTIERKKTKTNSQIIAPTRHVEKEDITYKDDTKLDKLESKIPNMAPEDNFEEDFDENQQGTKPIENKDPAPVVSIQPAQSFNDNVVKVQIENEEKQVSQFHD